MRYRAIIAVNAFLLCLIFGIVFTAQTLGFLGIYWRWIAIPMTFVVTGAALTGYYRLNNGWFETLNPDDDTDQSLFTIVIVITVFVFLTAVFGTRMILWAYSELSQFVPSDFYGYHALKALDLVRSHHYWNVTLPYGEYPLGYESLLAFSQALTGSLEWAGLIQYLLLLWLLTTLVLLLRRYAQLPIALAFIISAGLLCLPPLYGQLLTVGKNDVLVSNSVLAAVLHSSAAKDKRFHPLGLAFATMISIATKTTGIFILVYLWLLILGDWWQSYQKQQHKTYLHPALFAAAIGLMFPGGFWVLRNLFRMGGILSPELASFPQTTILSNLTYPLLYQSGIESIVLLIAVGYVVAITIFLWLNHRFGWRVALLMLVLALGFMATPLSAFHTPQRDILHVEWRYVLHGFLLGYVLLIALAAHLINHIWHQMTNGLVKEVLFIQLFIVGMIAILWVFDIPERVGYDPANYHHTLIDPYRETDARYDSVYDYVRQEIDAGVIYIERIEPFFLVYPNPRITTTYGTLYPLGMSGRFDFPTPDYAMVGASRELMFDKLPGDFEWELIFEDNTGRIYRRVP